VKVRTHWTVSALKDFETCPAKYQWSYLYDAEDWRKLGYRVVPSTGSPAMQRGTDIHQTCEDYLLGKVAIEGLHKEIPNAWRNLVRGLKDIGATPEEMWTLDDGWNVVPDNDKSMWLRMKIDAHYLPSKDELVVVDYKTGKPYTSNMEQVELYALAGFAKFDDVDYVQGELWYFDSDEPHEKTFKREAAPKLARKWEQRATALLEAKSYPAKLNRFCNWCPYNYGKGGPCTAPRDLAGRAA